MFLWYPLIFISFLLVGLALSVRDKSTDQIIDGLPGFKLKLILIYPLLLFIIGFLPATSLFLFFYSKSYLASVLYRLVFCIVISTFLYGVIYFGFNKPLPIGLIVLLFEG